MATHQGDQRHRADLAQNKAVAAPSPEALAEHFAHKMIMSNAKGVQEGEYIPPDPLRVPLVSWKIRYLKVLRTLQRLDTNKSVNGMAPKFLLDGAGTCADEAV